MRLLELFKGTGSFGREFLKIYSDGEVYSVDILKKYNPTWCGDIMDFDYKQFPVNHFDIITASPECKIFSALQYTWLKNGKRGESGNWDNREHLEKTRLEHGKFSKRTLDIIEFLQPKYWFVENPWSSSMVKLDHMKDLPYVRLDYCRFGFEYQKPTIIWTNKKDLLEHKCNCKDKKHKYRLGIVSPTLMNTFATIPDTTNLNQKYSIPPKLINYLFINNHH